ncbi:thioredoxin family protein [Nocardioides sp.]|uniref:TlpA family protein disulfide reductase n=1 Tax=Nocardioides sp. TaxID=35761 RepID=UPI002B92987C|nr:thioredoxin family protein [Nocardioides sp.]HSX66825.1 thioredoxin family protein [Nocardioides sp.]
MTTGQYVLVAAVVLAVGIGLWRLATDGRFRGTHKVHGAPTTDLHDLRLDVWGELVGAGAARRGDALGEKATLVQFSSAFCAPCRATRRILSEVTALVPGVRHVEIDAEHHLDLVRTLGILRTPTTVVLDASGREIARAQGAPTQQQVLTALDQL